MGHAEGVLLMLFMTWAQAAGAFALANSLSCIFMCHSTLVTNKNKQCERKVKDKLCAIVVQQNWIPSVKPGREKCQ